MNNRLFGFILKERRKAKGWSLENLSEDTGINKIALNRIELCKLDYKDFAYEKILNLLEFNIDEIDKINAKAIELFGAIYKKVMYISSPENEEKEFASLISFPFRSCGLVKEMYFLMKFVRKGELIKAKKQILFIERNIIYLEPEVTNLYYSLKVAYFIAKGDFGVALEVLKKIDINFEQDYQKAIIYNYFGKIYKSKREWFESFEYFNLSLNLFYKTYNFKRAIYCKMDVANMYFLLKKYTKGENLYLELLEDSKLVDVDEVILGYIYYNLCWCNLLKKEYEKTIYYGNLADSYENDIGNLKHMCLAQYELKEYELALNSIKEGIRYTPTKSENFLFFKMVQKMILDYNSSINDMIALYEKCVSVNNIECMELVLEYIVDYYEKNGEFTKLAFYQSKLIDALRNNQLVHNDE